MSQVCQKVYSWGSIYDNSQETLVIFAPNGNIRGHMTPMVSQMMLHVCK